MRRTSRRRLRRRTTALGLVAAVGAVYPLVRRPILNWGATAEEAASRLPGDEVLENADGVSTRAITIDASAESVWPWLAQMGPAPRGGAVGRSSSTLAVITRRDLVAREGDVLEYE